jgi:nucleoside-diphosphate-sugar epimerase/2-polyprenyl-3-methyl-5-hydroxy-6-metoxy-1,4-benzoquinol methylase
MRILITGGTGFIGSRLALRCLREGHEVRVLGRRNNAVEAATAESLVRAGAQMRDVSVSDASQLTEVVEGMDLVFHLAAAQHEANVSDSHFEAVNVEGTRNVLAASARAGVKRFVHGSTIGVYRASPSEVVGEDSPLEPDNIYGITKLAAERVVAEFGSRIPTVVIRISETYGPGDRRLLKLFRAASKGLLVQVGGGENLHHPIYIDDLLDGLLAAARLESAVGTTFVLAGPAPVSSAELLRAVASSLGGRARIVRIPSAPLLWTASILEALLRPLGIQPPLHRRRMDFFRKSFRFQGAGAHKSLGFEPKVDLQTGMAATARWYEAEGLLSATASAAHGAHHPTLPPVDPEAAARLHLTAEIEPFDSFWEAPSDIEKGYRTVCEFYRRNYLSGFPPDRSAPILVVSCGPGYMVDMLTQQGYRDVVGIDSDATKVAYAQRRQLDCRVERAFPWIAKSENRYQAIFCEQELNHLTKPEILVFLQLCQRTLRPGGTLIVHGLNGANPITGAEALAQNFDHYNTFTEYTLRQVLEYVGFEGVRVHGLHLYVFYKNPFNYVAWAASSALSLLFRALFVLYGKENRIFTKKIAAICRKRA